MTYRTWERSSLLLFSAYLLHQCLEFHTEDSFFRSTIAFTKLQFFKKCLESVQTYLLSPDTILLFICRTKDSMILCLGQLRELAMGGREGEEYGVGRGSPIKVHKFSLLTIFKKQTIFYNSFRSTAKLSEKYRNFQYAPPTCHNLSNYQHPN